MKGYLLISLLAFALLGLFVFGALFGDVDDWGIAYILAGAAVGLVFWFFTKNTGTLPAWVGGVLRPITYVSWALALFAALYGSYGLSTNRDLLSGQRYDGMAGMAPLIMLTFAFLSFLVGLLFYGLQRRR